MPIVTTTTPTSQEAIELARAPRDDLLVTEVEHRGEAAPPGRPASPAELATISFDAAEGPFATWRRTVSLTDTEITETIDYRSAVPQWGWLIDILMRRHVRAGVAVGSPPWWSPPASLSPADVTVLGLCATLSILAGFLGGLVGQSLTFVAADFGATSGDQSLALAVIRIGAVLTLIATALADRRGRRPILIATFYVGAITAAATALAPSIAAVTALQLVCRGVIAAAALLITVVCAEQVPAGARAYTTAVMAASGGLGVGMVLWLLPVVDLAPWGWRIMYACALPALVVAHRTLARLPESTRFTTESRLGQAGAEDNAGQPAHGVVRLRRIALLALALYLLNLFAAPVQQLQNDFLRTERGFNGTTVAVFLLVTSSWGVIGLLVGSQLADRRSRRLAASVGLVGLAIGNAWMFNTDGVPMWMASLFGSVVGAATVPAIGTLLPELFPTLRRGLVNGALNGTAVVGSISGLLIARHFIEGGNYGPTMAALAIAPLLVALLVWWLPETSRRELEEINAGDHSPSPP